MKETKSNDSDATPNVSLNEELNQLAVFQETISPREGIRNVHPELEVAAIESDQVDFVIFLFFLILLCACVVFKKILFPKMKK